MAPEYGSNNSLSPEYASPPPYIEAMAPETEGDGFYSLLEAPVPAPSMAMESNTDESSKLPFATPFSYKTPSPSSRSQSQYLGLGFNLCNSVSSRSLSIFLCF